MPQLQLPATPSITPSQLSLSGAALAVGEEVLQEVINAVTPHLATIVWAWYNHQAVSGFFGWAEHSLLGPIFTALFGPNPGVVTGVAAPAPIPPAAS